MAQRESWRRHYLAAAGALAALALACSSGPAASGRAPAPPSPAPPAASAGASPAAAPAPAPIAVRAAYTSIAINQSPWWMAVDAGYFREQGLDVDLGRVDAGVALLAAMRNGEIHLAASGGPTVVLGHLQGLETVIVGSASNTFDTALYVRPEIQTPADLRGQTIGVSRPKAISDVAARLAFERIGLQPDVDVFTRGTGGNAESLAAMETGVVAGASFGMPAILEARKRGYRELLNIATLHIQFLNAAVATTRRLTTEQPELADRTLRALAQAISRLRTDRDLAMQVIGRYTAVDDPEVLAATIDYYRPVYQTDLYPDPVSVQAMLDAEEHPAARTTRPDEVVDYRFADRLKASGFLDRLPQ